MVAPAILAAVALFILIAPNAGIFADLTMHRLYVPSASHHAHRWLQIALLSFAGIAAARYWNRSPEVTAVFAGPPQWATRVLVAVLAAGLLSSALSPRPWYGLREVSLFALLFVLAAMVAAATIGLRHRLHQALAVSIGLSAFLYVVWFLWTGLFSDARPTLEFGFIDPHLGFPNPRFFGQLQTWTLPLIVLPLIAWKPPNRAFGALLWTAAAGWWMLLFASGARAVLLAAVLAMIGVALIFGRRCWPWLRAHVIAASIGLTAYAVLPGFLTSRGGGAVARSLETATGQRGGGTRAELWGYGLELVSSSPLLGVGPGLYALAAPDHPPHAHPHNAMLQAAVEWGLPVALALTLLVGLGLWAWIRGRRRTVAEDGNPQETVLYVALTASLLAALIHSMLSGVIVMPISQTVGAIVVGWAWGIHLLNRDRPVDERRRSLMARRGTFLVLLLAVASLLVTANLPDRTYSIAERHQPRFWIDGWIP